MTSIDEDAPRENLAPLAALSNVAAGSIARRPAATTVRRMALLAVVGIALLFAVITNVVLIGVPYAKRVANERKALAGDVAAERREGHSYEFGGANVFAYGRFAPSLTKAENWYKKAAQTGDKDDEYNLAQFYENKFTDDKSPDALKWYFAAANHRDYYSMQRLADVYKNGELGQTPDVRKSTHWQGMASAHLGLPELRHNADNLNLRKPQFHVVERILATSGGRGGELTGYLNWQDIEIAELTISQPNKDVFRKFYYDHDHLFFVREIIRYFSYSEKAGQYDLTKVAQETETDTGILPSGKILGGDTPDLPPDASKPPKDRFASLLFYSKKSLGILRTPGEEVDARSWIPGS